MLKLYLGEIFSVYSNIIKTFSIYVLIRLQSVISRKIAHAADYIPLMATKVYISNNYE